MTKVTVKHRVSEAVAHKTSFDKNIGGLQFYQQMTPVKVLS